MQAVAGTTPTSPAAPGAPSPAADATDTRRASARVVAAVVLGLVALSVVFTGTGTHAAPADERPASERVVTP